MAGVDFVIKSLFETSGLRCDGDCVRAVVVARASKTKETKKQLTGFTALILFLSAECKSGKALPHTRRGRHYELIAVAFWTAAVLRRFAFLTHYLQVP